MAKVKSPSLVKSARELDKAYLDWVRQLPCLLCGTQPSEPHHINKEGHGGRGTKCPDRRTIPLCFKHHREIHHIGRRTFLEKYKMYPELVINRLNTIYVEAGFKLKEYR